MIRKVLRNARGQLATVMGGSGMAVASIRSRKPHFIGVLVYHDVSDAPAPYAPSVTAETFETHVRLLKEHFSCWKLCDLVSAIKEGKPLPDAVIAITFDDGYKGVSEYAYPILQRLGVPASLFVVPGVTGNGRLIWTEQVHRLTHEVDDIRLTIDGQRFQMELSSPGARDTAANRIKALLMTVSQRARDEALSELAGQAGVAIEELLDDQRMMSWDDIKGLHPEVIEIGSHSMHHPVLSSLPPDQVLAEMVESKTAIEEALNRGVRGFTYPNDRHAPWMRELAQQAGYEYACFVGGRSVAWPVHDFFGLHRIHVEDWRPSRFIAEISPIGDRLRKMRRRLF